MLRAASKFCVEFETLVTTRALLGFHQSRRHSLKTVLCSSNKDQIAATSASVNGHGSASRTQSEPAVVRTSGSSVVKGSGPSAGPRFDAAAGEPSGYGGERQRGDGGGRAASYRLATIGAAVAVTAFIGGALYYKNKIDSPEQHAVNDIKQEAKSVKKASVSDSGGPGTERLAARLRLPTRVEYLVVGGGTAGAGGARTLRALDPDARVLIVGEEESLPYPRAPLTKQLWSDPEQLANAQPSEAHRLTYTRWDGKTRNLAFEPESFYLPLAALAEGASGVGVARGWRVTSLDVAARRAALRHHATGHTHHLHYDQCLVATGARARRLAALAPARAAGRCGALRSVRDAGAVARHVARGAPALALAGDSERALELAASLRTVCGDKSKCSIIHILPGANPLEHSLPPYLQRDVTASLSAAGVTYITNSEIVSSELTKDNRVRLHLVSNGEEQTLDVDYVVECAGDEADLRVAEASGLAVGSGPDAAICVSTTLQAAEGVWAAGAAAGVWCRRAPLADSHEHALASARTAARNMAARDARALTHHAHRALAWCDVSPQLGYEAIGVIDSNLRTVGIFSDNSIAEDAMTTSARVETVSASTAQSAPSTGLVSASSASESPKDTASEGPQRFKKGVVFYLDKNKIVGVLLWNLFNRSDIARQALLMGEVTDSDLVEIGKHFSPQEP